MTPSDVLSSYLVIFPATLLPFCQSPSHFVFMNTGSNYNTRAIQNHFLFFSLCMHQSLMKYPCSILYIPFNPLFRPFALWHGIGWQNHVINLLSMNNMWNKIKIKNPKNIVEFRNRVLVYSGYVMLTVTVAVLMLVSINCVQQKQLTNCTLHHSHGCYSLIFIEVLDSLYGSYYVLGITNSNLPTTMK